MAQCQAPRKRPPIRCPRIGGVRLRRVAPEAETAARWVGKVKLRARAWPSNWNSAISSSGMVGERSDASLRQGRRAPGTRTDRRSANGTLRRSRRHLPKSGPASTSASRGYRRCAGSSTFPRHFVVRSSPTLFGAQHWCDICESRRLPRSGFVPRHHVCVPGFAYRRGDDGGPGTRRVRNGGAR